MAFTLPALPYAFDALEPHIDAKTMEIHHGKHHKAYVDNLNKALESAPADLQNMDVVALLRNVRQVPEGIKAAVINNGGGLEEAPHQSVIAARQCAGFALRAAARSRGRASARTR